MKELYWNSANGQSDVCMGIFDTEEEARAAIPGAIKELHKIANTQDQHETIDLGNWTVQEWDES
jgi:hypothetical protein